MNKRFLSFLAIAALSCAAAEANPKRTHPKLDRELLRRAKASPGSETTSVIVTLNAGGQLPPELKRYARRKALRLVNGVVLDVPNTLLDSVATNGSVARVSHNRTVFAHNFRTSITSGTFFVRRLLGLTGAGVGVAVIDSGIATFHDDFTIRPSSQQAYPYGDQRVAFFKDFINDRTEPYDDNGHGTHVSGIVAGNGYDSYGEQSGMAPGASIISLKVLDANGLGSVSDVIAALEWVAANARTYNIRIVNLSVGAYVLESHDTDPLTLAAKALVDQGIVVVAAAGNDGQDEEGHKVWGAIRAPGNAPWVLTVGASSSKGTFTREDDELAAFSSRGPTAIDFRAKPDILASGVGTISTAAPGSFFSTQFPQYLVSGTFPTASSPYLVLSGTSQATPVVSGTVALMLQANPNLTPNLVKAILQYTAQEYEGYGPLEQGAGFLNSLGAVRLAQFFVNAQPGDPVPVEPIWSQHIIWGNDEVSGGLILPGASAWDLGVEWGSTRTVEGEIIVWGSIARGNIVWGTGARNNIVWGTGAQNNIVWGTGARNNIVWGTGAQNNIVWGTGSRQNIVWGTACGGSDCPEGVVWGTGAQNNIVWGTGAQNNIVWGTGAQNNIVWGTAALGNIVWGTASGDDMVWGAAGRNNIVWGTLERGNIVWGTLDRSNIVWGTGGRGNIVWGTGGRHNIVWGTIIVWGSDAGLGGTEPAGGWYWWFLNPAHDFVWLRREFGETVGAYQLKD
jgi:serine protease AprX